MICNMFYYVGRRVLADITNQGGEVMDTLVDTREGQSSSAPATAEGVSEPSILANAWRVTGKF